MGKVFETAKIGLLGQFLATCRTLHDALRDPAASMNFAPWHYPSNTASAPFTASAASVTVFSSEGACTEMFSAKNLASVT